PKGASSTSPPRSTTRWGRLLDAGRGEVHRAEDRLERVAADAARHELADVRVVERRPRRRDAGDVDVELAVRRVAPRAEDQRRLLHTAVEGRIVELGEVDVVCLRDLVALE